MKQQKKIDLKQLIIISLVNVLAFYILYDEFKQNIDWQPLIDWAGPYVAGTSIALFVAAALYGMFTDKRRNDNHEDDSDSRSPTYCSVNIDPDIYQSPDDYSHADNDARDF